MIGILKNNPAALSEVIRRLLSAKIARYGEVTSLYLDIEAARVICTLQLKGEREPLKIELLGCSVKDGLFAATKVRCSRAWLEMLLNDHPALLSLPLSSDLAALIKEILSKKD